MNIFSVKADYEPQGDQPKAIRELTAGVKRGDRFQTLLGVTGSGKTFTMANLIANVGKPTLVVAHNKTLAAQLCNEFREFLPASAVEYFVSYYDYYQPEAYIAATDTYIEKDAHVNEEIDRLRHAATSSLLMRSDVVIVASVSCIYGLGSPENYLQRVVLLAEGTEVDRQEVFERLVGIHYERNDVGFERGRYRVRGDSFEVWPAYDQLAVRVSMWGDEIEEIVRVNPVTQEVQERVESVAIYPATHFVTTDDGLKRAVKEIEVELEQQTAYLESQGKELEAFRLRQRTRYDLEMLQEIGYCSGVENYSRIMDGRAPGEAPYTLLDYFPDDFLVLVDESHMTVPQLHGMYKGDRSRKKNLVDNGFRLPSALDNRPLRFEEFIETVPQCVFVSATPGDWEVSVATQVVEQLVRPTGLLDPAVTLVAILDADKEGFLRGETALIQTTGRAARNIEGRVIMYADRMTQAMERAIGETDRRRAAQAAFNEENGITPMTIVKGASDITQLMGRGPAVPSRRKRRAEGSERDMSVEETERIIVSLEEEMFVAAEELRFEHAAALRDEIKELSRGLGAV